MSSGFKGEHVTLGVYDPVYNPYNVDDGLIAYGKATVGPELEFPNIANLQHTSSQGVEPVAMDILAHAINVQFLEATQGQYYPANQYDGYVLAFHGEHGAATKDISSITLLATNIRGLTDASVQFNAHQVFINGSGAHLPNGQVPFFDLAVKFSGSDHHR